MARKRSVFVRRGGACHTTMIKYFDRDGQLWEAPYCTTHGKYLLSCLQCGHEFHTDRPHTKWCSDACRQKNYRLRSKEMVHNG